MGQSRWIRRQEHFPQKYDGLCLILGALTEMEEENQLSKFSLCICLSHLHMMMMMNIMKQILFVVITDKKRCCCHFCLWLERDGAVVQGILINIKGTCIVCSYVSNIKQLSRTQENSFPRLNYQSSNHFLIFSESIGQHF